MPNKAGPSQPKVAEFQGARYCVVLPGSKVASQGLRQGLSRFQCCRGVSEVHPSFFLKMIMLDLRRVVFDPQEKCIRDENFRDCGL